MGAAGLSRARRAPGRLAPALLCSALFWLGCAGPAPIVDARLLDKAPGTLSKVAVAPFYPMPGFSGAAQPGDVGGVGGAEAADLVTRFVTEALVAGGLQVVPPNDLVIAFEGHGQVLPRQDPAALAQRAASDFGASAVLLGQVMRYREREGGSMGALKPASVAYEIDLYTAPGGEPVFHARFDQTQPSLTGEPLLARQYPGKGTRWLSAAELARFGADRIVAALPEALR